MQLINFLFLTYKIDVTWCTYATLSPNVPAYPKVDFSVVYFCFFVWYVQVHIT
jgi:hypothetical protein